MFCTVISPSFLLDFEAVYLSKNYVDLTSMWKTMSVEDRERLGFYQSDGTILLIYGRVMVRRVFLSVSRSLTTHDVLFCVSLRVHSNCLQQTIY